MFVLKNKCVRINSVQCVDQLHVVIVLRVGEMGNQNSFCLFSFCFFYHSSEIEIHGGKTQENSLRDELRRTKVFTVW